MPPRKKIVKKAVKTARKTPSLVTESPNSTTPDINSTTNGKDGPCAAPEGSPTTKIPLPEGGGAEAVATNDDTPEMATPSHKKETLPVITVAVAADREDPAGGIQMALDSGETLVPEKSPTVPAHEQSPMDAVSLSVAVPETEAGDFKTAEIVPGVTPSDSKSGIPPMKKIIKKVVKVVRKVPIKKTTASESPHTRQSTFAYENTATPVSLSKEGDTETTTGVDDRPETEIPTIDSRKETSHYINVTAEAPVVDATPMVVDTDETIASNKSPPGPPQEPSSTDALFSSGAAENTPAAATTTPLAAPESKPDSKPSGKGKKIVVRKVKRVVKSGKPLASDKSPGVSSAKTPAADRTPPNVQVPDVIVSSETPIAISQDSSTTDTISLDGAVLETPAVPLINPGTGKKVVVRKVKKVVKKVVKVVKKGGEVKRVEEQGVAEKGGEHQDKSNIDLTREEECLRDVDGAHGVTDGNNKEENTPLSNSISSDMDAPTSLRQLRRKTEVFVGGLVRDAKEDDVRKVFGKAGEIVEVRIMMDGKTGKNKGYAFVRYATATQAKQAVTEFAKVEVCGKVCGAAALEGDDRIFLGNIDKKWKKEDIMKLLEQIGIEKIDALTLQSDPRNASMNRGFAFLEFETNREAQIAYRKLQKKNAFGKGMNVKVAWADPLNEPDEEDMQKVKSVFVEGIPSTWTEENLKHYFERYGEIERIVLACNMPSAKRKDFAFVNYTTREAARCCVDSFVKEELNENCLKINIKVSLAKPISKGKKTKGDTKPASQGTSKDTTNQRNTKLNVNAAAAKPSTTVELLHVLREQASWKHDQMVQPGGAPIPGYPYPTSGVKHKLSALESALYSDPRSFPRPRLQNEYSIVNPSVVPSGAMSTSLPYHWRPNTAYGSGGIYGVGSDAAKTNQSNYNAVPYGKHHSRY